MGTQISIYLAVFVDFLEYECSGRVSDILSQKSMVASSLHGATKSLLFLKETVGWLLTLWLSVQQPWVQERSLFNPDTTIIVRRSTRGSQAPSHTQGLDEAHYWSTIIIFPTRVTTSIMNNVPQLSSFELWSTRLIYVQVLTWGIILVSNAIPFIDM